MRQSFAFLIGSLLVLQAHCALAEHTPFTMRDLFSLARVSEPKLSPTGRYVAFLVSRFDIEKNEGDADIWLVDTEGQSAARQLTDGVGADGALFWHPNGRSLGFLRRVKDQPTQAWAINIDGGEPQALTQLPVSITQARWRPDGTSLVIEIDTWPDLNERVDEIKRRQEALEADKTKAKISDTRVLRYWDHYLTDGRVPHLFLLELGNGRLRDLMPGFAGLTGFEGFQWDLSADGGEVVYSANSTPPPWRTLNFDLYAVDIASGRTSNLTATNPGHDQNPRYATSGRDVLLQFTRDPTNGAEFAKLGVLNRATGSLSEIAAGLDAPKADATWRGSSREVVFSAELDGRVFAYIAGVGTQGARRLSPGGSVDSLDAQQSTVVMARSTLTDPADLWVVRHDGAGLRRITAVNDRMIAKLPASRVAELRVRGDDGVTVHTWLVYPTTAARRGTRMPVVILLHGGPFSAWTDAFRYRWNPLLFAERGYLVAMPNFRGSTGYGQGFAAAILGNHGELPAKDVLNLTNVLARREDVDARRIAIAGGSYGGYLTALLTGMTDRYQAAIVHAGVYDLSAQFASDAHWERPQSYGSAPWTNPDALDIWSPSRRVPQMNTPTLITHGERDYRVPVSQGINLHGALTGKGVPTRIVIFPEENHWILKPQAAVLWQREADAWLARYLDAPR
jgi:dipeptidyl aminopeptidase/acylaminoacyl peptidase